MHFGGKDTLACTLLVINEYIISLFSLYLKVHYDSIMVQDILFNLNISYVHSTKSVHSTHILIPSSLLLLLPSLLPANSSTKHLPEVQVWPGKM